MGGVLAYARGGPSKYDNVRDGTSLAIGLARCIELREYDRDFQVCARKLARKHRLEWSFRANRGTYMHTCIDTDAPIEMATYLLKAKANVNTPNADGMTPLMCAIVSNNVALVELFVSKGKPKLWQQTPYGENALLIALRHHANESVIGLLLAANSPLNTRDRDGNAALHTLTLTNRTRLITTMVKACARLDVLDAFGRTPIIVAGTTQNNNALRALVETERVLTRSSDGLTIRVKERATHAQKEMCNALSIRDQFGETALSLFVKLRWIDGVTVLLGARAEPNEHAPGGIPLLAIALAPPEPTLVQALLSSRANPNRYNPDATLGSPLQLAIKHRCTTSIRSLIMAKVDLMNALFDAALGDRPEIIRELLLHNASVNVKKNKGRQPLHIAASAGSDETIITLICAKADLNAKDSIGWTPEAYYARENYRTPWQDLVDQGARGFLQDSNVTLAVCGEDAQGRKDDKKDSRGALDQGDTWSPTSSRKMESAVENRAEGSARITSIGMGTSGRKTAATPFQPMPPLALSPSNAGDEEAEMLD